MTAPTGYAEELALERLTAETAEREAAEAWLARNYPHALRMRAVAADARKRVRELEAKAGS